MNEDCLKFRVFDKVNECYQEKDADFCAIRYNGDLLCDFWGDGDTLLHQTVPDEDAIIERCTGLKDRNGKLIYQGDVIKNPDYPSLWFVVWNEEHACFEKLRLDGYKLMKKDFPRKSETWIFSNTTSAVLIAEVESKYNEVVGHIHEPKWGIESEVKE